MLSFFSKRNTVSSDHGVGQPVIWIFQPPRSGGTLFLRLFDGHQAVHVHPAPITFSWPRKPDLEKVQDAFSMARFNESGFFKHASNRPQEPVPIDFDEVGYRSTFDHLRGDTPRSIFDAAHHACFQNWLDYRNRQGDKRYVMMHSTIWSHTKVERRLADFFNAYPDGWTIFIARPPADWLASGAKLAGSKLNDMEVAMNEYVTSYKAFLQNRKKRSIVLNFNALVSTPKATLSSLCAKLDIPYETVLETTSINGTPIGANSSHDGEVKFAPDPSLIGRGAEIVDEARSLAGFAEAERLFGEVARIADTQR